MFLLLSILDLRLKAECDVAKCDVSYVRSVGQIESTGLSICNVYLQPFSARIAPGSASA
jgi:hypothetical protein